MISLSFFSSVKLFSGLFLYEMSISCKLVNFEKSEYTSETSISPSFIFSLKTSCYCQLHSSLSLHSKLTLFTTTLSFPIHHLPSLCLLIDLFTSLMPHKLQSDAFQLTNIMPISLEFAIYLQVCKLIVSGLH